MTDKFARRRLMIVGLSVLLGGVLAAAALATALPVVTTIRPLLVAVFALLFGVIALLIDRRVISAMGPRMDRHFVNGRGTARRGRLLAAFLLAATVSIPVSIALFQPQIEQQSTLLQNASHSAAAEQLRQRPEFVARRDAIADALADAEENVRAKNDAVIAAEAALTAELNGTGSTRRPGRGPASLVAEQALAEARTQADAARAAVEEARSAAQQQNLALDNDIAAAAAKESFGTDNALVRLQGLTNALTAYPVALVVWAALSASLLLGDLLPVLRTGRGQQSAVGAQLGFASNAASPPTTAPVTPDARATPAIDAPLADERRAAAPTSPAAPWTSEAPTRPAEQTQPGAPPRTPPPRTESRTEPITNEPVMAEFDHGDDDTRPAPELEPETEAGSDPARLPTPAPAAGRGAVHYLVDPLPRSETASNLVWLNAVAGISGNYLLGLTVNKIGRSHLMDVVIPVRTVSSHHCTITNGASQLLLSAEDTRNGTYLNGRRLAAGEVRLLRDGDELGLGTQVRLKVSVPDMAAPAKENLLMHSAGASAAGNREINEDRYLFGERVIALADGVGGRPAGALAATLTVQAMETARCGTDLTNSVRAANAELLRTGRLDAQSSGMASTLDAIVVFSDGPVHWINGIHVGDGAAMLQRPRRRELIFLTRPHTLAADLIATSTDPTSTRSQPHPDGDRLMRAVGLTDDIRADEWQEQAEAGQRYLLASDGLAAALGEAGLRRATDELRFAPPQECATALVGRALQNGAPDNVTVVVADIVDAAGLRGRPTHRAKPSHPTNRPHDDDVDLVVDPNVTKPGHYAYRV
ncbi:MAG: DUF4407 domain-containing protein [Dehalococcoidia bacterium]